MVDTRIPPNSPTFLQDSSGVSAQLKAFRPSSRRFGPAQGVSAQAKAVRRRTGAGLARLDSRRPDAKRRGRTSPEGWVQAILTGGVTQSVTMIEREISQAMSLLVRRDNEIVAASGRGRAAQSAARSPRKVAFNPSERRNQAIKTGVEGRSLRPFSASSKAIMTRTTWLSRHGLATT